MKKIFKSTWFYFVIILLIIISFYGYKNITGRAVQSGEYDEFAKYLTSQGVKMYGTEWCSYCKSNKKTFGSSFQYIDFIDCDKDRSACRDAGISGYPTWNVDGENYPGEQSLERLAQLTNYGGEI